MAGISPDFIKGLGYTPEDELTRSGPGGDVSFIARPAQGGDRVVIRVFSEDSSPDDAANTWTTDRWNTMRFATGAYNTGDVNRIEVDHSAALLQVAEFQWDLGCRSAGEFIAPILSYGVADGHVYTVRRHYPSTLHDLVDRQVEVNPQLLYRIVDRIWTGLAFLHQSAVNQPHGRLCLANVARGPGTIQEAAVLMLDPVPTPETKRAHCKREDFRQLGLIIYQLASRSDRGEDAVDALVRCREADWKNLGKTEAAWKALVARLLETQAGSGGFDPVRDREASLKTVLPSGSSISKVPPPAPLPGTKPVQQPDPAAKQGEDLATARRLLADGKPREALAAVASALRRASAVDPDWLPFLDDCAASLPDEILADHSLMADLESAAERGSGVAALQLARGLLPGEPAEALPWLEAAVAKELHAALPLLAHVLEFGGAGLPKDPARALECYRKALAHADDPAVRYRLAGLLLREPELQGQAEAAEALQQAHAEGHYQSTDLLAQCYAHGAGVPPDEQQAFKLFLTSWRLSQKAQSPYFTASHNLGVCFAVGFGTRKDVQQAKHYFRQGEISGHEPSKQGLATLLAANPPD